MGGNALKELIPGGTLPRMLPQAYQECKAKVDSQLKTLYRLVGTPAEAPEKADHGDVDYIVQGPYKDDISTRDVEQLIGAVAVVSMEGNRTSNYAIPGDSDNEYRQIDVHVCADELEWKRIMFYNSYGDLGMILGLLAGSHGLQLGNKGLKVCLTVISSLFSKGKVWHLDTAVRKCTSS